MLSIVLLQNDPIVAMGLRRAIESESELRVAGIAHSLAQIKATLERPGADLLVSDLHVVDGRLTDLLRDRAQRGLPGQTQVMALAMSADDPHLMQALRHGAHGYFIHGTPLKALRDAVRQVLAGESPMSPSIARRLKSHFTGPTTRSAGAQRANNRADALTETERQMLNRVSEGYLTHEIAREMHITVHGVGLRLRSLYRKLHTGMHAEPLIRQAA